MENYDMNNSEDLERMAKTAEDIFIPIMDKLGDVDDLFLFRSLLASFIENWSLKYDYSPVYIAVSTANMVTELHCNTVEYDDDEEDDVE